MNTIQNEWQSFYVSTYAPLDVPKSQEQQCKGVFYHGAKYVMTNAFMIGDESVSEEDGADLLGRIDAMVDEFYHVIGTAKEALFSNRMLDDFCKYIKGITDVQRQELRRSYMAGAKGALHCLKSIGDLPVSEAVQVEMVNTLYEETLSQGEMQVINAAQQVHKKMKKKKRSGRP